MVARREEQFPLVCLGQPSFIPGSLDQFRASLNMDLKVIGIRFKDSDSEPLLFRGSVSARIAPGPQGLQAFTSSSVLDSHLHHCHHPCVTNVTFLWQRLHLTKILLYKLT